MTPWSLFLIGLAVSSICVAGVMFTIVEMRKLGREAEQRALSMPPDTRSNRVTDGRSRRQRS